MKFDFCCATNTNSMNKKQNQFARIVYCTISSSDEITGNEISQRMFSDGQEGERVYMNLAINQSKKKAKSCRFIAYISSLIEFILCELQNGRIKPTFVSKNVKLFYSIFWVPQRGSITLILLWVCEAPAIFLLLCSSQVVYFKPNCAMADYTAIEKVVL